MDDDIIRILRDLASDFEDPDPYSTPLSEISDFGDQAVSKLVETLGHSDPLIRRMSALSLELLAFPVDDSLDVTSALPYLERILEADPHPEVRRQAAESLWSICGHAAAVEAFLTGLGDEDVEARRWGAITLGLAGKKAPCAIQPLIEAVVDSDLLVRRYAAEALAMHGAAATSALPKLEQLLDEDEWTRLIGVEAILSIDSARTDLVPIFVEAMESRSVRIRRQALDALTELPNAGKMLIAELIDAMDDEDEIVRMASLNALEKLGPAAVPAIPTLISILQGDGRDGGDVFARDRAVNVLATIGEQAREAVFFLMECLNEPGADDLTSNFRLQVVWALWRISGEPDHLLARALELLHSPNWWLRGNAAAALGELGPAGQSAVPDLRQALEDEHPSVRRQAGKSLHEIDPLWPDAAQG